MERVIDAVFLVYFLLHIPIYLFFDSQALFPRWIYPTPILELTDWYTSTLKDSMMVKPPAWFQAFVATETVFQLPFFFVAVYVFWTGVSRHKWFRIPALIYSTHLLTVLFGILSFIAFNDFSQDPIPGPTTLQERFNLMAIYLPFFIVPLVLFIDVLMSDVYKTGGKKKKQ